MADTLREFCQAHYKPDRLQDASIAMHADFLASRGWSLISRYESRSGEPVYFDARLNVLADIPLAA